MNGSALLYLGVASLCGAIVAFLTPIATRLGHRHGLVDHPSDEGYKWHFAPTPHIGGLSIIVVVGLALTASIALTVGTHPEKAQAAAVLLGALLCGAVGAIDDVRPLGAKAKVLPVVVASILLWIVGVRSDFVGIPVVDFIVTVGWMVVATHSLNVIDNMDGVAIGLTAISSTGFLAVAAINNQRLVPFLCAATVGAALGFLPFNFHRATIFLGDSGTLFLGFILAALALALDQPHTSPLIRLMVPALLLGVPLFNTLLVTVSRARQGRPLVVGATDGAAHRLITLGLSRSWAAAAFWSAQAVLAVIAIGVSMAGTEAAAILALVGAAVALPLGIIVFEVTAPHIHDPA